MICGEYLMEPAWDEGFTCSLITGHDGPHRAEGGLDDINVSRDGEGREYTWVFEWAYTMVPDGLRHGPQGAPYERD